MENIKQDFLRFPKLAYEYHETWKELLNLFPKTDFLQIKDQEQWDNFYATLSPSQIRSFRYPHIKDLKFWQYAPVTEDPVVQEAIHKFLNPQQEESKREKNRRTEEVSGTSRTQITGKVLEHDSTTDSASPLKDVVVTISDPDSELELSKTSTNDAGDYASEPLPDGKYKLIFALHSARYHTERMLDLTRFNSQVNVTFSNKREDEDEQNDLSEEEKPKRITQNEAAAAIAAASAMAPLSEIEQATQIIQNAASSPPLDPVAKIYSEAKNDPNIHPLGFVDQFGQPLKDNSIKPSEISVEKRTSSSGEGLKSMNQHSSSPSITEQSFSSSVSNLAENKTLPGFVDRFGNPLENSVFKKTNENNSLSASSPKINPPSVPSFQDSPPILPSSVFYEDGTSISATEQESPPKEINSTRQAQNLTSFINETNNHIPHQTPPALNTATGESIPPRPPRPPRIPRVGASSVFPRMGGVANIAKLARVAGPIMAFLASPPGWFVIAALIVFIILIIIIIIFFGFDLPNNDNVNVSVQKTGPEHVENDQEIEYQINVSWSGSPNTIVVKDKIPDNAEFATASGNFSYDEKTRTVTWNIPN